MDQEQLWLMRPVVGGIITAEILIAVVLHDCHLQVTQVVEEGVVPLEQGWEGLLQVVPRLGDVDLLIREIVVPVVIVIQIAIV